MRITAKREKLADVIGLVGQAVASKSTKKVFECLRLVARKGALEVAGTDLEVAVRCRLAEDLDVREEGEAVVPAALLAQPLPQSRVAPPGRSRRMFPRSRRGHGTSAPGLPASTASAGCSPLGPAAGAVLRPPGSPRAPPVVRPARPPAPASVAGAGCSHLSAPPPAQPSGSR
jgi:hypothetical protein